MVMHASAVLTLDVKAEPEVPVVGREHNAMRESRQETIHVSVLLKRLLNYRYFLLN